MFKTDVTKTYMHKIMDYDKVCVELTALRAENERLRSKLDVIASDDWNNPLWVRKFAKEALK